MKVLEDTPAVFSLGKFCDEHGYSHEWINGQKHFSLKKGFEHSVTWKTSHQSWFLTCHRALPPILILQHLTSSRQESDHPTSSSSSPSTIVSSDSETRAREDQSGTDSHPAPVSSPNEMIERGDPLLTKPTKNPKPKKNENHGTEREWLQEFREILVDDEIPLEGGSHASSSHEKSLELMPSRSVDLGKHSAYTHFPEDRDCEICQRTKITRAPCRRFIGAVPRAEFFGDLISRGAGPSHSMDPGVSVQNQNFTRNQEKLAKVPGTREES